jgi:hypothetical protein
VYYSLYCTTAGNIATLDILRSSDYSWDKDAEYILLERAKQNNNQQVIDWMEQQIAVTENANAKKAQQRTQQKENTYFPSNINKNHLGTAFGEQLASNQQAYMTQKRDTTATATAGGSAANGRQQQQQQQQQSNARQTSASNKASQTTVTPRVRIGPLLETDSTLHTRTPLDHDFVVSVIRDMQPDDRDEYSDNDSSNENRTS